MARAPSLPLWVPDFMASTVNWTGPERGLYLLLLAMEWAGGPLPVDRTRLARVAGFEPQEFERLWAVVGLKFKALPAGLVNARLEEHRQRSEAYQALRVASAHLAADARWNAPGNASRNAGRNASAMPPSPSPSPGPSPSPSPSPSPENTTAAVAASTPAGFDEFRQNYPERAGSQPWSRALKAWNARRRDGRAPESMIGGARRYREFILATGKSRTEFVMQAATFLGPDCHFELAWHVPAPRMSAWDEIQQANGGHDAAARTYEADAGAAALAPPGGDVRSRSDREEVRALAATGMGPGVETPD